MLAPYYRVVNATINSFGTLVNVAPDGNCFFTAHWEVMHYLDTEKPELNIHKHRNTVYNYGSKKWKPTVCKVFDSFGKTSYSNM